MSIDQKAKEKRIFKGGFVFCNSTCSRTLKKADFRPSLIIPTVIKNYSRDVSRKRKLEGGAGVATKEGATKTLKALQDKPQWWIEEVKERQAPEPQARSVMPQELSDKLSSGRIDAAAGVAWQAVMAGEPVTVCQGPGGSGKTSALGALTDALLTLFPEPYRVAVTASTHAAAAALDRARSNTDVAATTFNHYFRVGILSEELAFYLQLIKNDPELRKKYLALEFWVHSELAMQSGRFELMNQLLQEARQCDEPYGGVKLLSDSDQIQQTIASEEDPTYPEYVFELQSIKDAKHVPFTNQYRLDVNWLASSSFSR